MWWTVDTCLFSVTKLHLKGLLKGQYLVCLYVVCTILSSTAASTLLKVEHYHRNSHVKLTAWLLGQKICSKILNAEDGSTATESFSNLMYPLK